MKKILIKISAFVFVIIIMCISTASYFSAEITQYKNCDNQNNYYVFESPSEKEKKYYCKAKIDDNFIDNELVVVFNHETSLKFYEYSASDFPGIDVEYVEQLSYNKEMGEKVKSVIKEKNRIAQKLVSLSGNTTKLLKSNVDFGSEEDVNIISTERDKKKIYDEECEEIYKTYSIKKNLVNNYKQTIILHLSKHSKQNVIDSAKELENRDDIIIAEPNYLFSINTIPNDTYYQSYQDLNNYAANKLQLEDAWNITTGDNTVKVGVLDTGILNSHPDLENNVDTTLGYSYHNPRTGIQQVSPLGDGCGHGTLVSGVIGAKGNNNLGITGVNWDIDLVSLRYIHRGAENSSDPPIHSGVACVSFYYAENNDIDIVNCSFGGCIQSNLYLSSISDYSGLAVCAAGNNAVDIDVQSYEPAGYNLDNIISVAATDDQDSLASFSNYGSTNVDIAAPGVNIFSTYISNNLYESASGTSLAAPYVSGTAALIKSIYPTMTTDGLKKAILDGADYVPGLNGKVATSGRLNAYKAIQSAQNHTYTIIYNKNGGSGTDMANTSAVYGVPTPISDCEYNRDSEYQRFTGWTAQRNSDHKWLYSNPSTQVEGWYVQGYQPSGYIKKLFKNGDNVTDLSYVANDTISFFAQWEPFKYYIDYYFGNNVNSQFLHEDTLRADQTCDLFLSNNLGYTFNGWKAYRVSDGYGFYTNGNDCIWASPNSIPTGYYEYYFPRYSNVVNLTDVNEDTIRMFAQVVPNEFTLEFYTEYGTGSMASIDTYTGNIIQLPPNEFVRTGYVFDSWILVDEFDYYYCFNGNDYDWFLEQNIPSDYEIVKFDDEDSFSSFAYADGDYQYLVAQWKILKGDVNRDGQVTSVDVLLLQQYIVDSTSLNSEQIEAGDVDEDGIITVLDIILIQQLYNL